MGRPIYPYELSDPDFSWLLNTFRESHPEYFLVEDTCLPVVFIPRRVPLWSQKVDNQSATHGSEAFAAYDQDNEFKPLDVPDGES